ncbi:MAG: DUF2169 domain-containing protein [Gammaproteobacteria bacterium]|nr:DUF2169 domain-containing protein [Gammaproteobacteria bacterium]
MAVRNVKPMTLSLMSKAYTRADQHRLVVVALGYFELGKPVTRFLNEHEAAPRLFKALPKGEGLDALYPKARGELLLVAEAHAAAGQPVESMPVRVQLADIDKTLKVIGNREVRHGLLGTRITDPEPFTVMPLDWRRAYGGPAHACNAAGVGYSGKRRLDALPNIEYPRHPIRHGNQKHAPAGFGPRSTLCPDRQKLMGTFDKRWRTQHAPHLPADFDPAAFNAAPGDQHIKGWFKGGEAYRLEGLHPDKAILEGRLPAFRPRVLAMRKGQTSADAGEVDMHFDTVWLLPHLDLGVAIYRGETDCADVDAEDIEALCAAYEDSAATPRPADHYRAALAERIDPKTRHLHVFNDAPLSPEQSPEAIAARRARLAEAEAGQLAEQQALLDELDAEFWAEHPELSKPVDHQPPQAQPSPLGFVNAEAVLNGDIDLGDVMAKAKAKLDEVDRQGKAKLAELEQRCENGDLAGLAQRAGETPPASLAEQKQAAAARAALDAPTPLAGAIAAARASGQVDAAQIQQMIEADAQLLAQQRKLKGLNPKPDSETVSPEIAAYLRELVELWLAQGEPLAGRDLRGVDLSHMDLSGQDLSGCNLDSADLRHAHLRNANCQGTCFTGAQLARADLGGADLSGASLNRVQAEAVVLRGATLDRVTSAEADLRGADLRGVHAVTLILTDPDLRGARWDEAELDKSTLLNMKAADSHWRGVKLSESIVFGAQLGGAHLDGARFRKVVMSGAAAPDSHWRGAYFEKTLLNIARLGGADFRDILGNMSCWRDSDLHASDWRGASLHRCDLGEARLLGADLRNASFAHSVLLRSDLSAADARGGDFFQTLLRAAKLIGTDLRDANLVRAIDAEADYTDARFDGAVRTTRGEAA